MAVEITIRPIRLDDADFLYRLMTTEQWHRNVGDRGISSVDDATKYILDKMDPDISVKGFVNHIITDTNGVAVGTCSLRNRPGVESFDIGYAILEGHEGKGYATAGAREMVRLAFKQHQVDKVSAITIKENKVSCRVLEKLGFKQKGIIQLPNDDADLLLYELEQADWSIQ